MIKEMTKTIPNKSKTYLLPLLAEILPLEYIYLIKNTYILFNNQPDYSFGILYHHPNDMESKNFYNYLDKLINTPIFIDKILLQDGILLVFLFPEEYLGEYDLYKEGQYSMFSKAAKDKIIRFTSKNYTYPQLTMDITQILYKNRARKERLEKELGIILRDEDELTSKMLTEDETFKI